ncbi:MAG: sugar transferase [Lachnospiraceae bacterium]
MYRFRNNLQNIFVLLCDCIAIAISMHLANYVRHGDWMPQSYVTSITAVFVFACVATYLLVNMNSRIAENGYFAELLSCVKLNLTVTFLSISIIYVTRIVDADFSRKLVMYFLIFNTIITYVIHLLIKYALNRFYSKSNNSRQLMIICDYDNVSQLVDQILQKNKWDYRIRSIAVMDSDHVGENILDIPIVAKDGESVLEYCKSDVVDEVLVVTSTKEMSSHLGEILSMGITVHVGLKTFNLDYEGMSVATQIGGQATITYANRFLSLRQAFAKRILDIVGALVGSAITLVLTIIIGPLIKLDSPGPIFFAQKRVGKNGRYFKMYKFRSMYTDAEERKKLLMEKNQMNGLMFKMDDDPRITRIGKFLRKTSLDEFPQFFNVLKGDMSLVGTRPPTVDEFLQYHSYHKMRLSIKPGITGLWQISGRSDITDFEEVVRLDVKYINEWNFWLDIKILLKTIGVVLDHKGAK